MFPIVGVDRKYCCYNAAGVYELIYCLKGSLSISSQFKDYKDRIQEMWRAMFDLGCFETRNWKFAGHLKMNGITTLFTLEVTLSSPLPLSIPVKKG